MKKSLLACAVLGALALTVTVLSTALMPNLSRLEALPDQTSRRVFLRTGDAGWSDDVYMYSWGSETITTPMTHVFDFNTGDGLFYADITISKVDGFLFLDGEAISGGAPNWSYTDTHPWKKTNNASALPSWGSADVYTLKGIMDNSPSITGGKTLSLSASQLAQLLKRYTSCSSDAYSYTNSCLAYPQLQADFNIDSFATNTTAVPAFAGGEKTGTTVGAKVTMMKHQYQHYDDNPPSGEEPVILNKTPIEQTYADVISNSVYTLDGAPTIGTCNLLVIPVWFTDSSNYISTSYKANVRSDIQTAYFGTTTSTGWHSVKSYYEAESKGKLTMTGVVSDWYSAGISSSTAASYSATQTASLVINAADWYFTNNTDKSRADFDCDSNGFLDGVLLIYAAPNYADPNSSASSNNLWAYCFWAQDSGQKSVSSPGVNVFFWASYDFMYGSNRVNSRTGKSTYHFGDDSHCTLDAHTYIHEMGHVFGLDDYYDYGPNSYTPAGSFSMQDYNVGGHDPFSVMSFGWADPYIPTESCEITIGAFQTTHEIVLLTPSWNTYNSPFDEYLLLELYTPTGLNTLDSTYAYNGGYPLGPSAPGIRLWHVDARLAYMKYDGNFKPSQLTSNARYSGGYGVATAFSNSYGGDHISVLGSSYTDYNLLQLVRNNASATYRPSDVLSASSLFRDGDAFDMSTFRSQFVNSTNLNNGTALGWSFSVSISASGAASTATINLVRA